MSGAEPYSIADLDQARILGSITLKTLPAPRIEAKLFRMTGISAPDFARAVGGRRVSVSIIIEMARLVAAAQDDLCQEHRETTMAECAMSTVRSYKYGKLYRATKLLGFLHKHS
jgi:hypothetical protein